MARGGWAAAPLAAHPFYMSTTLYQSSDVNERTERQLAKALQELDALKKQNEELQKLANELK